MFKFRIPFYFLITTVCSVILCSCLSVNRNIKLNKDGSGSEVLTITFSKEFYSMMASMTSLMDSSRRDGYLDSLYSDEIFVNKTRTKYDSIPGIIVTGVYAEKGPDSSNNFIIRYDFDSIQKIGSSLNTMDDTDDNSKTLVTWTNDGANIKFDYLYEQLNSQPVDDSDSLSQQLKKGMEEFFKGDFIKFEIEFPYEVVSSNATSVNGNTLTWNFPISDMTSSVNLKLEAIMKEE